MMMAFLFPNQQMEIQRSVTIMKTKVNFSNRSKKLKQFKKMLTYRLKTQI